MSKQNYHHRNLRMIFGKYMRTIGEKTWDVWLMSGIDKKMIAGHQFVLGACSPHFDSIFNEFNTTFPLEYPDHEKPKMVILMSGYSSKTLQKLKDFMYKGPDELHDDSDDKDWEKLFEVGKEYEIYGLMETIMEKRKINKDVNENLQVETNGIYITPVVTKLKSLNLIDLDDFLDDQTTVEDTNKAKWIEKAEKITEQIKNGSKKTPKTARKLLNDIFSNSIKYLPAVKDPIHGKTLCTAQIDNIEYTGVGDTVDDARESAAIQVLNSYLNIKFPFSDVVEEK